MSSARHRHRRRKLRAKLLVSCAVLGATISTFWVPTYLFVMLEIIAAMVWVWLEEI